jgi:hypothetical protein
VVVFSSSNPVERAPSVPHSLEIIFAMSSETLVITTAYYVSISRGNATSTTSRARVVGSRTYVCMCTAQSCQSGIWM